MTTFSTEYGLILLAPDCSNEPDVVFALWQSQQAQNDGFIEDMSNRSLIVAEEY